MHCKISVVQEEKENASAAPDGQAVAILVAEKMVEFSISLLTMLDH